VAHSPENIHSLLPLLDEQIADDLETETLDFKECPTETKLRKQAKEMAICLGNASGGTVVFGVRERALGCDKAIVGSARTVSRSPAPCCASCGKRRG